MDSSQPIVVTHPGPAVVKITLNRPKALNAINVALLDGLVKALREHISSARVIVLEGAGDRSFCAGEDLKQTLAPLTGTAQELRTAFDKLQDITRLTSASSCVIVAAVQGFAIGGGAEIALAADFVIGGPNTRFRFPEVPIGHAHTGGITLRLTQLVGLLKAKELLLTGRWVDADEAAKIGMLTTLVSEGADPKVRAVELALELAKLPATSLSTAKSSLERAVFVNTEANLQDEVNAASYCFAQSDAAKAFSDFAIRSKNKDMGQSENAVNGANGANTTDGTKRGPIRDINSAWSVAIDSFPSRTILRFGGKDYSFHELDVLIGKVAGNLRHRAGISEGDRVLVLMRNSVEMATSWLATNRLGAVWVPINAELRSVSLKHAVEAAKPKLAVVDAEFLSEFRDLGVIPDAQIIVNGASNEAPPRHATFTSLTDDSSHAQPVSNRDHVPVLPATTSAFLYTSGTTGRSKPCILSHEYFVLQAQTLIDSCGLRGDDVLYCPFPLFHADATALTLIPAILLGAVAALSNRFSASRFWDEVRATEATVYDFMGATLALIYKQPPSERDRDHRVRLAWGVPIPSFAPEYVERFGHPLLTLYGSVEASLPIFQAPGVELPRGSCGRARPGHQVRIVDDNGDEVAANTPGQLLVRSDAPNAFFHGYFDDPAATAAAFRGPGGLWLHTGDLARADAAGNLYFAGRVKDVIRRRGENVNAAEVEEELMQHPDVVLAAAYGIPSALGAGTEEDIKVAVQTRPASGLSEETLWRWAAKRMARFQVPSVVHFVDDIKKTPTGKVEKGKLPLDGGHRFDIRSVS